MEKNYERKKALEEIDKALEAERREQKIRITTFIDGDILDELKDQASKEGLGYQTLLNQYLRSSVLKEVPSSLINRLLSSAKELARPLPVFTLNSFFDDNRGISPCGLEHAAFSD